MGITDRRSYAEVGSRRLYECDGCKNLSSWRKGWLWYGSYRDLENDPENVRTFCSDDCAEAYRFKIIAMGGRPDVPEKHTLKEG